MSSHLTGQSSFAMERIIDTISVESICTAGIDVCKNLKFVLHLVCFRINDVFHISTQSSLDFVSR
jgi:hypothetical protein